MGAVAGPEDGGRAGAGSGRRSPCPCSQDDGPEDDGPEGGGPEGRNGQARFDAQADRQASGATTQVVSLKAQLIERIAVHGPMTVADFMIACLHDPQYG